MNLRKSLSLFKGFAMTTGFCLLVAGSFFGEQGFCQVTAKDFGPGGALEFSSAVDTPETQAAKEESFAGRQAAEAKAKAEAQTQTQSTTTAGATGSGSQAVAGGGPTNPGMQTNGNSSAKRFLKKRVCRLGAKNDNSNCVQCNIEVLGYGYGICRVNGCPVGINVTSDVGSGNALSSDGFVFLSDWPRAKACIASLNSNKKK